MIELIFVSCPRSRKQHVEERLEILSSHQTSENQIRAKLHEAETARIEMSAVFLLNVFMFSNFHFLKDFREIRASQNRVRKCVANWKCVADTTMKYGQKARRPMIGKLGWQIYVIGRNDIRNYLET